MSDVCPCDSGNDFNKCCGPFLAREKLPPTAAELMRSRYSAFAKGDIEYLVETHDPAMSQEVDREGLETWSKNATWRGLKILATDRGTPADTEGKVEFVARYVLGNEEQNHHEISDFVRKDGRWYFHDGKLISGTIKRAAPKVGRNDPCSCGSGKKFKKCCGAQ